MNERWKMLQATILLIMISVFGSADLLGAGATFPQPLYSKMFAVYQQEKGVRVNYQGVGSGAGKRQLVEKVVDFGGTDAFMTDKEIQDAGAMVLNIPICIGAVVLSYNLPGNPDLKLTPELVSKIFSGAITKWEDPQIGQLTRV